MFTASCGGAWLGFSELGALVAGVNRAAPNLKSSGSMVALVFIGVTMAALVIALSIPNLFDRKRHPRLGRVVAYGFAGGVFLGVASLLLADIVIDEVMTNHGYRVCSSQFYTKSKYTDWALTGHACKTDDDRRSASIGGAEQQGH